MSDELATDITLTGAVAVGVGTMIGAGVFVLPSLVVAEIGPVLVAAFLLAGLVALLNGLVVSELGTAMPAAGGSHHWVTRTLGPLFGTVAGVADWLGLTVATAFYALGFGVYLDVVVELPAIAFGVVSLSPTQFGAVLAGLGFVALNYVGARVTGWTEIALVGFVVTVLVVLAAEGVRTGRLGDVAGAFGGDAVLTATALVFVSYLGYAKVAALGEELVNPSKTLPRAVLGSIVVVTLLYTVLMLVVDGVVDYDALADEAAILAAAEALFGTVGVAVFALVGLAAMATSANVSVAASSRVAFGMGRMGLVAGWFDNVHPRFSTPYRALQVTGALVVVLVAVGDLLTLAVLASALHLVGYTLLAASLVVVRQVPDYEPDFRVPAYPLVALAAAGASVALVFAMGLDVVAVTVAIGVGAIGWYLLYGRHYATEEGLLPKYLGQRAEELPPLAASAVKAARPETVGHRTLVALSNPRTEADLMALGCAIAAAEDGEVLAVHIVTLPDQVPLARGPTYLDRVDEDPRALLDTASEDSILDVPVETRVIYSHQAVEEVFATARRADADSVVMGWRGRPTFISGRAASVADELAHDLPCDTLVLKDEGFDPSRIVIPTVGTDNDALCAGVARVLQETFNTTVTLLHVVDGEGKRRGGERFLEDWADTHDLDAETIVDTSGDVERAIAEAAADHTMLLISATERGLLSRLVRRTLVYDVVEEVDCTVLLAERPGTRSLRERLIG
ncbi:transport protein (probable substrate cationic amino acids) [Natronomonas pharaonis DSM 2160]|uniref:Transport protein (Probable substrate cationic amino acids) n=1 Tax=Natronomonas pharaonis (strain ATCC 35678 / DSM 2160 / CIP 103997 / JCM 8858 / NBRC 14720 / NCIMB 2260 / Gabara) TaxID=348780 RepID=A0A1U7EWG5_NATPD|nr:amino acid permease [Natronomonas pharaonis]CAI49429.1 transport protein (probable substrate cationic amino acids) [Natronomonas pharaonis DSM 2160]